MEFHQIINATYSKEPDRALMQKDAFPVNASFGAYLRRYGRDNKLPISYNDLSNYSYANSLKDNAGKWTQWENAIYEPGQFDFLKVALVKTFIRLKNQANPVDADQYNIERIDFCAYGNSIPFRIKIIDKNSRESKFFYIKLADASRIYGLELEHLLSDNSINFLCHQNTLVEEHIEGIPGDIFLQQHFPLTTAGKTEIARAFVQFNERCFARLLGDMRSYNFVVNFISPLERSSGGEVKYVIRAIDFDQQCYEGKKNLYFPQVYKENLVYVQLVLQHLTPNEIEQNQQIAFSAMAAKIIVHRRRLMELLNSLIKDEISEYYKVKILRKELNEHFNTTRFTNCKSMGAIVKQQLKQVLQKHVQMANFK